MYIIFKYVDSIRPCKSKLDTDEKNESPSAKKSKIIFAG
jgi:hypothetical protein